MERDTSSHGYWFKTYVLILIVMEDTHGDKHIKL